ncbi:hypothetical protein LN042_08820 [Kitasatospora sp. RB6PN24]|uniref:hypothetical protein n=1 Tax=Kitasatospora humi TaxID=2893891 RepID=UPI001E60412C|nr:hypothetical protein [Kitasatospora humi]MCC9307201.1 hypothetical protein [Kitasatospora humi]
MITPETSRPERPAWWRGLRSFMFFLVNAGLATLAYAAITHRPGHVPWIGLLFGALVYATLSTLFPRRRGR